jgi:Tfp pilus assembly protein PilV
MRARSGHTLVEVLVAGLILLTGLVPVAAALGNGIRLAIRGRASAEAALAVMARLEQLRILAGQTTPRCSQLTDGSAGSGSLVEQWAIRGTGETRTVSVVVRIPLPAGSVVDSGQVQLRCT